MKEAIIKMTNAPQELAAKPQRDQCNEVSPQTPCSPDHANRPATFPMIKSISTAGIEVGMIVTKGKKRKIFGTIVEI